MKKSIFSKNALQHIYQRSVDKGVIFYSLEDRLVYYTTASVYAKKYKVKVFAAAIMFTHTHQAIQSDSLDIVHNYLRDVNSIFARLYNHHYRRQGQLFETSPGCAQKRDDKAKRSVTIYVSNNHVEKRLCVHAIEYRWSFLCYGASSHPFSPEINIRNSTKRLKRALKLVDRRVVKHKGLEYCDLASILPELNKTEKNQFVDYVISRYAWIDFSLPSRLFGSFEKYITAVDSMTGSEYDLNEDYTGPSDIPYRDMIKLIGDEGMSEAIYSITDDEKRKLYTKIYRKYYSPAGMILRFLHLDPEELSQL